ncbi:hypothetical protein BD626DRAFT_265710 [Schizophyllum amplum]|uniref:Uncharacterized protein n=1 Tax=Schizophyllum amplum TaxID=97359 RepID=A0A550CH43_9AGAR|nr:hypothetical protein BD626DRAFT_265710 [Auriculariopsis ampla]
MRPFIGRSALFAATDARFLDTRHTRAYTSIRHETQESSVSELFFELFTELFSEPFSDCDAAVDQQEQCSAAVECATYSISSPLQWSISNKAGSSPPAFPSPPKSPQCRRLSPHHRPGLLVAREYEAWAPRQFPSPDSLPHAHQFSTRPLCFPLRQRSHVPTTVVLKLHDQRIEPTSRRTATNRSRTWAGSYRRSHVNSCRAST